MNILWIVLALTASLLVVVTVSVVRLSKHLKTVEASHRHQVEQLRRELAAINSAAIGVGQRLISAEKKLKAAARQDEARADRVASTEPLEKAASAAEQGITAEALVERYGLSEAEAGLLALIKTQGAKSSVNA